MIHQVLYMEDANTVLKAASPSTSDILFFPEVS